MKYLNYVFHVCSVLVLMDIIMVLLTIYAIGMGADVQHIDFWDSQIKFLVNLIS